MGNVLQLNVTFLKLQETWDGRCLPGLDLHMSKETGRQRNCGLKLLTDHNYDTEMKRNNKAVDLFSFSAVVSIVQIIVCPMQCIALDRV